MMWFMYYWMLCGVITSIAIYFFSDWESDEVDDMLKRVPLNKELIRAYSAILGLLLGGAILPYSIIEAVYQVFTGKSLDEE